MRSTRRNTFHTKEFQEDIKRKKSNGSDQRWQAFLANLAAVIELLQLDRPLPLSSNNHRIKGAWQGWANCWNCYVDDDLILLYQLEGDDLYLRRLATYSEIFA